MSARETTRTLTAATGGSRGTMLEVPAGGTAARSSARALSRGSLKIRLTRTIRTFARTIRALARTIRALARPIRTLARTIRTFTRRALSALPGGGMRLPALSARMAGRGRIMRRRCMLFFFFVARESQRGARYSQSEQQPHRTPYRFRGAGI